MDITKSREEFEKWLESRDCNPVAWLKDAYWEVWQASRESLVVELPELPVLGSNADWYQGFAEAAKCMRSACSKSIRAAGIRIKGNEKS
ncbi:TPA: hypothetical protein ACGBIE_002531 [Yersinia enterocolitica]